MWAGSPGERPNGATAASTCCSASRTVDAVTWRGCVVAACRPGRSTASRPTQNCCSTSATCGRKTKVGVRIVWVWLAELNSLGWLPRGLHCMTSWLCPYELWDAGMLCIYWKQNIKQIISSAVGLGSKAFRDSKCNFNGKFGYYNLL